jgi:hypothetical protein
LPNQSVVTGRSLHVVGKWLGNSEEIARRHYFKITGADFDKVFQDGLLDGLQPMKTASNKSQQIRKTPRKSLFPWKWE